MAHHSFISGSQIYTSKLLRLIILERYKLLSSAPEGKKPCTKLKLCYNLFKIPPFPEVATAMKLPLQNFRHFSDADDVGFSDFS